MKKINKILITAIAVFCLFAVSCENYLEPDPQNRITLDDAIDNPVFAEGLLLKAYNGLPTNYNFNLDVASDDAVTNDNNSSINAMTRGGWTSIQNPFSIWSKAYEMNLYINTFLENADKVVWFPSDATKNENFKKRIIAEAYGLRAWWSFQLLQNHSGVGTDGTLLGFPIVDRVIQSGEFNQLPRNTFKECVDYIIADCDKAIAGLPARWETAGSDPVMGIRNLNRISGLAAMTLKSTVALYAASPSYNAAGAGTWEDAANYAADVIIANGGINLLASDVTFYENYQSKEIFWSSTRITNKFVWEQDNFPPSLFGKGKTNPTQNFVDSFGMVDGKPITVSTTYNPNNPYNQRDPRLAKYVIYNNLTFGTQSIKTYENSGSDGLNNIATSTISGYYLRKFLNPNAKLNPAGVITGVDHFYTYSRFTEALLNFAEAANEAGGPDFSIKGYTARGVINAIRTRSGINSTYTATLTSADAMRTLIRNERRIELSFEGNRFWDLRRWGLTNVMKEDVKGMRISQNQTSFSIFTVAPRSYQDYQIYGPVPLSETQKYDLIQNKGW
ncbi:Starch-binding associating with outer membrane [Flavobacterium flevense]|uniref:Carbohydrate-binding protein n=1 Tax=Flavobacterium flevense TaxID=983 RepID=A0A4Y4AWJ1_9FLAO|nr:RagB/SusD family nutrient uptake outer membrane protein [Flavobacterium flevense]GEC72601.1 carbohydrate-binding protein [Flavobacterium flevense]SHM15221.1 Starch-binding associating with outer membrane [Flavobacterium flevense]